MSKQDRMYELAGTSYYKRVMTFRFADGKVNVRAGVLRRAGHEDIQLHQLPHPMTKEAAAAWLTQQGLARNAVMPYGHRKTKNPKKERGDVQAAPAAPAAPVKTAEEVAAEMAAAKLAAKRARDAERKRAKRAAAKAGEAQVAEAA